MRTPTSATRVALAATAALALVAGCGTTADDPEAEGGPFTGMTMVIPNTAGGGYDITGRSLVATMEEDGLAEGVEVSNLPGAGGTVGLARTIAEAGNEEFLLTMGLGVVGAAYTNETDATVAEATPIARLIEESGAIFVPADSEFQTVGDLVAAWEADPSIPVGGGSSPGGPDHLLPMQLAQAVGIAPTDVNFVSYAGGGEMLPALLDGQITFAASGYGEYLEQVEGGTLRALATTGAEREELLQDVPTLIESGIDLEFTNWRGLLAPPDLSDEETQRLIDTVETAVESDAWAEVLETNGWTGSVITGDEFAAFLTEQDTQIADLLTELGLR